MPPWLEGRWRVKTNVDGVSFPIGRQYVSEALPGFRMASILPLPNVGNTPTYEVEYAASAVGGAVEPMRGANAAATLEAFWPAARVVDVSTPSIGRLLLRYEGPTRSKGKVAQSVDVRLCSSEGGPVAPGPSSDWVVSEVYQQDNVEQGSRGASPALRPSPWEC